MSTIEKSTTEQFNAFTVDLEDYFQVTGFERDIAREDWGQFELRVAKSTHKILELLERRGVKATFFVLGWLAERCPELVREIRDLGHEIGSHSFWHRLIYTMSPDEFRDDLRRSRSILEETIGQSVRSYRAPSFSITRESIWALEILVEEGFRIDSSIFPIFHDRYGIPDAETGIHRIDTPSGSIWEFPSSVTRFGPFNLPVSGGGYFRLLPTWWTRFHLHRLNAGMGRPFMFYIHPWEVDPDQPRLRAGSWVARRRHYVNLSKTESKLKSLLWGFRFGRLGDVIERAGASSDVVRCVLSNRLAS